MAGANYIHCAVCHKKALYIGDQDYPEATMVICATCAPLHVAVPIEDIEDWVVAADDCRTQKQWPVRGVPSEFHFPWLDDPIEVAKLQGIETWLRSLLPESEEAND